MNELVRGRQQRSLPECRPWSVVHDLVSHAVTETLEADACIVDEVREIGFEVKHSAVLCLEYLTHVLDWGFENLFLVNDGYIPNGKASQRGLCCSLDAH